MGELERAICDQYPNSVVLNCRKIGFFTTFQGIDCCGFRLFEDIIRFVDSFKDSSDNMGSITSISFVGYSLGGLICRYCIGLLENTSFFETVKPIHLITIATPHLGTRLNSRHLTGRVLNSLASLLVYVYAGRSGEQIVFLDGNHAQYPLLLEISLPSSCYMSGLRKFSHVYVYANARNDNTVPYCTASLSYNNKWKVMDSSKVTSTVQNQYSFVLECKSIKFDKESEQYNDRHLNKQKEISCGSILMTVLVLIVGLPLLAVHVLFVAAPLRLISSCYSAPVSSKLCSRTVIDEENGEIDPDLCPWVVLKHLRENIDIHRVSVLIPGAHTHGKIICRFQPNEGGLDVIRHLLQEVLPLRPSGEHIDNSSDTPVSGLGEDITDVNINIS